MRSVQLALKKKGKLPAVRFLGGYLCALRNESLGRTAELMYAPEAILAHFFCEVRIFAIFHVRDCLQRFFSLRKRSNPIFLRFDLCARMRFLIFAFSRLC